jgi:ATP-dependent DNA helicase RecQ
MAERRGLPAYMILHDSALREMARRYPRSIEELTEIARVGSRRASQFGEEFLKVIAEHECASPQASD